MASLTSRSTSADLLLGHLAAEGEVEAQALGGDVGALLSHLVAQHLAQRRVQQVRGGVQTGASGSLWSARPPLKRCSAPAWLVA